MLQDRAKWYSRYGFANFVPIFSRIFETSRSFLLFGKLSRKIRYYFVTFLAICDS